MAKVNAEMTMMTSSLPSAVSKKDFVIWSFELAIKWKEEAFFLPITEANRIAIFDEALQDEMISIDVVIFGRLNIYFIYNLFFKLVNFIF